MSTLKFVPLIMTMMLVACNNAKHDVENNDSFEYNVERFADVNILRYKVTGFESLTIEQKELIYYLSQAAIEGRDIMFDQNYKYNLAIRKALELIYTTYDGDMQSNDFKQFEIYLKRVWFSNGIHHHYSMDKFTPEFSRGFFEAQLGNVDEKLLPLAEGEGKQQFIDKISEIIFNPAIDAKRVNQKEGDDLILTSANNYYGHGITEDEVVAFYGAMSDTADKQPVSHGLNSTLTKVNGSLVEEVWRVGGKYSAAIEKIVYWLEKAREVAENEQQQKVIALLIEYYNTGDLQVFDQYNIQWLSDTQSHIDFVNGFIETYGDPLGIKASWESVVNFKDVEATRRTDIISSNAQWFEDNSPVNEQFKKKEVKGVTAKVIVAAMLGGDCYPATPLGINLPNADWIRKEHGSKSVTIENIASAYDGASRGNGFLEEFVWDKAELERAAKYSFLTDNLHTDLHECLGHGSGQLLEGVSGNELKAYGAVIEEARADLFGLYYVGDDKMVVLGLLPDAEAYKAQYDKYLRNGLMTQLTRINLGNTIEQTHMRNRQLIARWVLEKGAADSIIEQRVRDGKTYFVINDYKKLRSLFGQLLAEIQRIKSTGDFKAAQQLVENYAVKIDATLHAEILDRYAKLNLSPYSGFVNPVYEPVMEDGKMVDVKITYTQGYAEQMLQYSKNNSW
jgi:dipeptidyl-peptidase III